jgi:hypothetical protein
VLNISRQIFLLAIVSRGLLNPVPLSAQDVVPRRSRHSDDRRAAPRIRLGGRRCRRRVHADGSLRRYNHNVRSLLDRWELESNQLMMKVHYTVRR